MLKLPDQRLYYVAAVTAVLLASPVQADAQTAIIKSKRPVELNADGGVLAWSAWRAARHEYRLTLRVAGRTYKPPVAGRKVPFDVDVGTDSSGHETLTYSRCRKETSSGVSSGTGCDLWAFRVGGHKERRLKASTPSASETNPSMRGGRLAFVRVHERRRGLAGVLPALVLVGNGKERNVAVGPRGTYEGLRTYSGGRNPMPPRAADEVVEGPDDVDLGRDGLTYLWSESGHDCPDGTPEELPVRSSVRFVSYADLHSSQVLDKGCSSGRGTTQVFSPAANEKLTGWLSYEGGADAVHLNNGTTTTSIGFDKDVYPAELALDGHFCYLGTNGFGKAQITVRRYRLDSLPARFGA